MKLIMNFCLIVGLLFACHVSTCYTSGQDTKPTKCFDDKLNNGLVNSMVDVFNDCDGKIFCMGDSAGCVEDQDCDLLVTAKLIKCSSNESESRTIFNIYLRELVDEPSNKKALVWMSFNHDPPRFASDRNYPIEALVPFIELTAEDPLRKDIQFWNYETFANVYQDSGFVGLINRRIEASNDYEMYANYGYYLTNHQLKFWPFIYNDTADAVYVHAVLFNSNETLVKVFCSDKAYLLSNLNGSDMYPIQVDIKDFPLEESLPTVPPGATPPTRPPTLPTTPLSSIAHEPETSDINNSTPSIVVRTSRDPESDNSRAIGFLVGTLIGFSVMAILYSMYEYYKPIPNQPDHEAAASVALASPFEEMASFGQSINGQNGSTSEPCITDLRQTHVSPLLLATFHSVSLDNESNV